MVDKVADLNKKNDLEPCPKPHVLLWNALKGGCICGLSCLTPGNEDKKKPLFDPSEIKIAKPFYPGSMFEMTHPIPQRELEQWSGTVMMRYIYQMFCCGANPCNPSFNHIPCGWLRYTCPQVQKISDAELGNVFSSTIMSTFMKRLDENDVKQNPQVPGTPRLKFRNVDVNCDYPDRGDSKAYTTSVVPKRSSGAPKGKAYYYKIDFEMVKHINPMGPMGCQCCEMPIGVWSKCTQFGDRSYACGTVALFRRYGPNDVDPFEIVGIKVVQIKKSTGEEIVSFFTPEDKDNWELAKLYLLSNSMMSTLFIDHPSQAHFPMSTLNSYAKCHIPQDNVLYQLLEPHFYLHMGVNDVVRFNNTSVAMMEKSAPFNCFTFAGYDESFKFLQIGLNGIEGNDCYQPYKFDPKPREIESLYGRFLATFYPKCRDFVNKVLDNSFPDQYTCKWADAVAPHLPGFPTGRELKEKGRDFTVDVIAKVVWLSSIEHSTTHYSFSQLPKKNAAMRIRVPPPCAMDKDRKVDFAGGVNNIVDRYQQFLAWQMFFTDEPVLYLKDVKYQFESEARRQAGRDFLASVEALCKEWGPHACIDYDKIASSVQY